MSSPKNDVKYKRYDIDALDYRISGVITDVSENERMLPSDKDYDKYLLGGRSVMNDIISGINAARQLMRTMGIIEYCTKILDFPCGHGRVLRFLKAKFPNAEITAGDIIHEAVDYCVETFDIKPLYSKENLRELSVGDQYDFIWCGSLITHFCEKSTIELLDFFVRHLVRGGLLTFTTHGRSAISYLNRGIVDYAAGRSEEVIEQYKSTGYYYKHKPGNPGNSGIAFYSPSRMFAIIEKFSELKVISYSEGGWGNHQDVITCMKGDWHYA
jgi:2-polyprenyl-3-methyl-5-hydroxy-6-metoxy-1,4-benzoquinol methylase